MTNLKTLTALFLSCAALAACGGGGGSDGGNAPSSSPTSNPVSPPPPAAQGKVTNFNAGGAATLERTAVASGEQIVLNWSSLNADTCTLGGAASGSYGAYGQQSITAQNVTAPTVLTYSLVCGTSDIATTSITVLPARTLVPDAGFQLALKDNGLTVASDGSIDTVAALAVYDLEITKNYGIVDLTGIGSFRGLTKLQVQQNPTLTNVSEISLLTQLTFLDVWKGAFTSFDVSALTNLTTLGVSMIDGLNTVDISKNVKLTELDFQNDTDDVNSPWGKTKGLTSLDISHNVALARVYIGANLLTSIDTSKNVSLVEAWFEGNPFAALDFSKNTQLNYVIVYDCAQLTSLNIKGIKSGTLPARLTLDGTALTSVTVSNAAAYSAFVAGITPTIDKDSNGVFVDYLYNSNGISWRLPASLVFVQ